MKRELIVLISLVLLMGVIIYESLREDASRLPVIFKDAIKEDTVPIDRKDIARIEIFRPDGIFVIEKGRNGRFSIKAPIAAKVDSEALDRAFQVFEKMRIVKTYRQDTEEIPLIFSEYGLDKPRCSWRFKNDDADEFTLVVGKDAQQFEGFFARWQHRDDILVLGKEQLAALDVEMKDLQDKEIFEAVSPESVTEVNYGGLRLLRDKNGWRVTVPFEMACRGDAVSRFIEKVGALRAVDFMSAQQVEAARKGDGAAIRLELAVSAGKGSAETRQTADLCGDIAGSPDMIRLLKDKNGFVVLRELFAAFPADVMTFAERRVVPFAAADVSKIQIGEGAQAFTFVKEDGGWERAGYPDVPIDGGKVDRLVGALTSDSVKRYMPFNDETTKETRLLPPQYILAVNGSVTIALSAREGGRAFFLRDDSKNVIGETSKEILSVLSKDPDAYREKNILRVDPRNVTGITLARDGKEYVVERTGDGWEMTAPVKGKIAAGAVDKIIRPLSQFRAIDFIGGNDRKLEFGLAKPALAVTVRHDGRESTLMIGDQKKPYYYYGAVDGVNGIFTVSNKVVKQLQTDLLAYVYLVETDSNRDGKADSWTYFDKGRKTKVEMDIDNDGKADVVNNFVYGPGGELIKIETDNNKDGKADQISCFVNGILDKEESDADYNGAMESVTYFRDGKQEKSEIDLNGDGKPDVVKTYILNSSGEAVGADVDENADGAPDYKERYEKGKIIKESLPAAPAVAAPAAGAVLPAVPLKAGEGRK